MQTRQLVVWKAMDACLETVDGLIECAVARSAFHSVNSAQRVLVFARGLCMQQY